MAKANFQSFYRTFLWVSFLVFVVSLETVAKQGKFDADGKNNKVKIKIHIHLAGYSMVFSNVVFSCLCRFFFCLYFVIFLGGGGGVVSLYF